MFDSLSSCEQAGVERFAALVLVHDLFAFLEDALDGLAGFSLGALTYRLKYLLQTLDLLFGFVAMSEEGVFEFFRSGRLRHLRKRLEDLPLGKVDILQSVVKKVVEFFLNHG